MFDETKKKIPKMDPLPETPSLNTNPLDQDVTPSKKNKPKLSSLNISEIDSTTESQVQVSKRKNYQGSLRPLNPTNYNNSGQSRPKSSEIIRPRVRNLSHLNPNSNSDPIFALENNFVRNSDEIKKIDPLPNEPTKNLADRDDVQSLHQGPDTASSEDFDDNRLYFNEEKKQPLKPSPPKAEKHYPTIRRGIPTGLVKPAASRTSITIEDEQTSQRTIAAIPSQQSHKDDDILWADEIFNAPTKKRVPLKKKDFSGLQNQLFKGDTDNTLESSNEDDRFNNDLNIITNGDDDMKHEQKDLNEEIKSLKQQRVAYERKKQADSDQISSQAKDIRDLRNKLKSATKEQETITTNLKRLKSQHSIEITQIHDEHIKQNQAVNDALELFTPINEADEKEKKAAFDEEVRQKINRMENGANFELQKAHQEMIDLKKTIQKLERAEQELTLTNQIKEVETKQKNQDLDTTITNLTNALEREKLKNDSANVKESELRTLVEELNNGMSSLKSTLTEKTSENQQNKSAAEDALNEQRHLKSELTKKDLKIKVANAKITRLEENLKKIPKPRPNAEQEEKDKDDLIATLKQQIETMSSQIQQNSIKEEAYNKTDSKTKEALAQTQKEVQYLVAENKKLLQKSGSDTEQVETLLDEIKHKEETIKTLHSQSTSLEKNIASLKDSKNILTQAKKDLQKQLDKLQKENGQSSQERNDIIAALHSLREEFLKLDPDAKFAVKINHENLVEAIEEISAKIEEKSEKITLELAKNKQLLHKNKKQKEHWGEEVKNLHKYIEQTLPQSLDIPAIASENSSADLIQNKIDAGKLSEAIRALKAPLKSLAAKVKENNQADESNISGLDESKISELEGHDKAETLAGIKTLATTFDKFQKTYKDNKPKSILEGIIIDEDKSPCEILNAVNNSALKAQKRNEKIDVRLNEKIENLQAKNTTLKKEKEQLMEEKTELETSLGKAEKEKTDLTTKLNESKRANKALGQQISSTSLPVISTASAKRESTAFRDVELTSKDMIVLRMLTSHTGLNLNENVSSTSDVLKASDILKSSVICEQMKSNLKNNKVGDFNSKNVKNLLEKLKDAIPNGENNSLETDSFASIVDQLSIQEIIAKDHKPTAPNGNPQNRSKRAQKIGTYESQSAGGAIGGRY